MLLQVDLWKCETSLGESQSSHGYIIAMFKKIIATYELWNDLFIWAFVLSTRVNWYTWEFLPRESLVLWKKLTDPLSGRVKTRGRGKNCRHLMHNRSSLHSDLAIVCAFITCFCLAFVSFYTFKRMIIRLAPPCLGRFWEAQGMSAIPCLPTVLDLPVPGGQMKPVLP